VDNDYEMTFSNDTVIELCNDEDNLPHITYNFVPFSELTNRNPNDFVDVIGVMKSSGEMTTIVTKATNRELKKRELQLVDNSNYSVSCTLWGKQAEEFDANDNPVILLKGAKLGDYNGRNLSVTSTTIMQINPDIAEAHKLRGWFDQGGCNSEIHDLSKPSGSQGASGMGGQTVSMRDNWKTLDALKDERMGMGDKADYFTCTSTILYARKENSMYMACPGENCNKKVIDQNDGTYRCEKCAKNFENFKWRMILSVSIMICYTLLAFCFG
jgi:replication factor A1